MAIVVPVVTTFDAKGISKAISNFKKLEGSAARTGFVLRGVDQGLTSFVGGLAKVGAAVGLVGGIIGGKLVASAYEAQKVFKQTEQLISTTGFAAGHTAQSLSDLAGKISEQIGVDDELIQKSANLLITFKQVQNQVGANNNVFDRAVMAAQDLGNVFGSAEGAAMQLGKALADPEAGISALRRSGINFTESQKELIRSLVASGDVLGAQKVILSEVEAQVGGTARASATNFDRMKVAIGNLAEDLGALLIPKVEKFALFVKDKVIPYINNLIALFKEDGLGGVIGKVSGDFVGFTTRLDGFGEKIFYLIGLFAAFKLGMIAYGIATAVTTTLMMAFGSTAAVASAAAAPIALIAFAIVAVGVALVMAYLKFEGFRKVVNFVINAVIGYFEVMINAWIFAINLFIKAANAVNGLLSKIGIKLPVVAEIGKVSFGRIGSAAQATAKKIGDVADETDRLIQRFMANKKKAEEDPPDPGGGGESAIEKAKRQLKEYTDGLKSVKEAQNGLKDSSRALAESQRGVLNAARDVRDAQNGLRLATKNVMLAEEALERVRRGLGAGSDESKRAAGKVSEAQRSLEESGYSLEDAQFALIDATTKLAELRASKEAVSLRDIRQAEIELSRAKLALTERQIAQTKSTEELSTAQTDFNEITDGAKEGTDRYKEANDALTKAKLEQDEASKKVLDALEKEQEAIEKVTEAQNKLRDATYEVLDAEKALKILRQTTPKELREDATDDFINRQTNFAAGVLIPNLPDIAGLSSALNPTGTASATTLVINAPSLDPRAAKDYVYDALIEYQRYNGPLSFQIAV